MKRILLIFVMVVLATMAIGNVLFGKLIVIDPGCSKSGQTPDLLLE